ncbi:hypothetical protein ACWGOK_22430 [Streptomyces eurythermus]
MIAENSRVFRDVLGVLVGNEEAARHHVVRAESLLSGTELVQAPGGGDGNHQQFRLV